MVVVFTIVVGSDSVVMSIEGKGKMEVLVEAEMVVEVEGEEKKKRFV